MQVVLLLVPMIAVQTGKSSTAVIIRLLYRWPKLPDPNWLRVYKYIYMYVIVIPCLPGFYRQ